MHKAAIARFSRTLSTMFAAGVPLVEALESVAGATGSVVYSDAVKQMREEGIPVLEAKFQRNLATRFPAERCDAIFELCKDQARLEATPVHEFMELFVI